MTNAMMETGIRNAGALLGSLQRFGGGPMEQKWDYEVGDLVKMKKPHPCGSKEWEILRVGADFRLQCLGCGRQVMLERRLVEKNTRGLTKKLEKT